MCECERDMCATVFVVVVERTLRHDEEKGITDEISAFWLSWLCVMQQCFLGTAMIAARPQADDCPRLCLRKASRSHSADWLVQRKVTPAAFFSNNSHMGHKLSWLWSLCLLNTKDDTTGTDGDWSFPPLLFFWFHLILCRVLVPVTQTAYNGSPGCPSAVLQAVCYSCCTVCGDSGAPAAGFAWSSATVWQMFCQ